jgi:hypothetical protein
LRTALGHAAERAEALLTPYNSSEQELQELRNAALETCRAVEEGEAQAGSSLASRLRALSGHVTECMRAGAASWRPEGPRGGAVPL